MTGMGIPNSHSKMPRPMTIPPILVAVKNFSVGFMFHLRKAKRDRVRLCLVVCGGLRKAFGPSQASFYRICSAFGDKRPCVSLSRFAAHGPVFHGDNRRGCIKGTSTPNSGRRLVHQREGPRRALVCARKPLIRRRRCAQTANRVRASLSASKARRCCLWWTFRNALGTLLTAV